MSDIVLATINARYHHASLGLRYLKANLAELAPRTRMLEFTLEWRADDIVEQLLAERPRIVALGVYIWNVTESGAVAALVRQVAPEVVVVLGGPEVGCADDLPPAAEHADYVITGQADFAFAALARRVLAGTPPDGRVIAADNPPLARLALPYAEYDDEDIARRMVYVEASRGCPFRCTFCLSSLDRTAWHFDIERIIDALDGLYRRGLRQFRFVDRTFNLKRAHVERILGYFLDLDDASLFLHFELIPDRLPDAVRAYLPRFAPGTLQFEIGIQTFNPDVQAVIRRRQDDAATCANLAWLRSHTHAHIHADLIFGLPGEDLASFARGFDRLYALNPDEIQIGILKRLRGSPLVERAAEFGLRFDPAPPYRVLASDRVDFDTVQRVSRLARYYDMIANSGRFATTMSLFRGAVFERLLALSDGLYRAAGRSHRIALPKLVELLHHGLVADAGLDAAAVTEALAEDYRRGRFTGAPACIAGRVGHPDKQPGARPSPMAGHASRQARHVAARRATARKHVEGDHR